MPFDISPDVQVIFNTLRREAADKDACIHGLKSELGKANMQLSRVASVVGVLAQVPDPEPALAA